MDEFQKIRFTRNSLSIRQAMFYSKTTTPRPHSSDEFAGIFLPEPVSRYGERRLFSALYARDEDEWRDFLDEVAEQVRGTKSPLAKEPPEKIAKSAAGWMSPGLYSGQTKASKGLTGYQILAYDIDGKNDPDEAEEFIDRLRHAVTDGALSEWFCVVHATYSHSESSPSVRALFPIAEQFTGDKASATADYRYRSRVIAKAIWGADDASPVVGLDANASVTTPARLFFLPVIRPGAKEAYDEALIINEGRKLISVEDIDRLAEEMFIDRDDRSTWPAFGGLEEQSAHSGSGRREDPNKSHVPLIRAFARYTGSIERTFDEVLVDDNGPIYVPSDTPGRYKHRDSRSNDGVVLHEDPKAPDGGHIYATSYHSNRDPASGLTAHAFDFCRVHWFGHLDSSAGRPHDDGKPKSHHAMLDFLAGDDGVLEKAAENFDRDLLRSVQEGVQEALKELRLEDLDFPDEDDFDDDVLGESDDREKARPPKLPEDLTEAAIMSLRGELVFDAAARYPFMKGLLRQMEVNKKTGVTKFSDENIRLVLENDPRALYLFARSSTSGKAYLLPALYSGGEPFRSADRQFSELRSGFVSVTDNAILAARSFLFELLFEGYGMDRSGQFLGKLKTAASELFDLHGIDELEILRTDLIWRASIEKPAMCRSQVEDLMCDVLGLDVLDETDRWKAWISVAAALHRLLPKEPIASLYVPILYSPKQGCGKSELVNLLAGKPTAMSLSELTKNSMPYALGDNGGFFTANLLTEKFDIGRKFVEAVGGKVVMELPEAYGIRSAPPDGLKAFFDAHSVTARLSYARSSANFCVRTAFYITTNVPDVLSDQTGNRRFVLIPISTKYTQDNPMPLHLLAERLWDVYMCVAKEFLEHGLDTFHPSESVRKIVQEELKAYATFETAKSSDAHRIADALVGDRFTTEHFGIDEDEFDDPARVRVLAIDRRRVSEAASSYLGKSYDLIMRTISLVEQAAEDTGEYVRRPDGVDRAPVMVARPEWWDWWENVGSYRDGGLSLEDVVSVLDGRGTEPAEDGDDFDEVL